VETLAGIQRDFQRNMVPQILDGRRMIFYIILLYSDFQRNVAQQILDGRRMSFFSFPKPHWYHYFSVEYIDPWENWDLEFCGKFTY